VLAVDPGALNNQGCAMHEGIAPQDEIEAVRGPAWVSTPQLITLYMLSEPPQTERPVGRVRTSENLLGKAVGAPAPADSAADVSATVKPQTARDLQRRDRRGPSP
jgi:hypothetical protein